MVIRYLASLPTCAFVVLLHWSRVVFSARLSPSFIYLIYLHKDCKLLWFLQLSYGLGLFTAQCGPSAFCFQGRSLARPAKHPYKTV